VSTDASGSAGPVDAELVASRLEELRRRIERAGGDPAAVRILAVTKTFPVEVVRAAWEAGLSAVGENYADELVAKASALREELPGLAWHFLGAIQRNKLGRLAPFVSCYEGVDRLEEGQAIARRRPGASVLVEVDTAHTPGRGGVAASGVAPLVGALRDLGLDVAGLMTVAPPDPVGARAAFELVASLRGELGLREASMGMSGDLEVAVAAGATEIRVGTALFGPRAAA
jgi:PLP dependent protein